MADTAGTYTNGSDLLLSVGGQCIGHCTSHTITYNADTKDRSVKPVATEKKGSGKWKSKSVTGLSISISAEGCVFTKETENGYEAIAPLWGTGDSVEVKAFEREGDTNPSLQGKFVITSLELSAPASDDATYSISLESDGEPTIYPGKATA